MGIERMWLYLRQIHDCDMKGTENEKSSHEAQSCPSLFRNRCPISTLAWNSESVSLAVRFAGYFIVVHVKLHTAMCATEAMRVKLLLAICLQVLSFDAFVALSAQRVIELVIVLSAVWGIAVDVEFSAWKWCLACLANEAFSVIATGEATVSSLNRLAVDVGSASTTFSL